MESYEHAVGVRDVRVPAEVSLLDGGTRLLAAVEELRRSLQPFSVSDGERQDHEAGHRSGAHGVPVQSDHEPGGMAQHDGLDARVGGRTILGERTCTLTAEARPGAPVLVTRCRMLLGEVSIRPARPEQSR